MCSQGGGWAIGNFSLNDFLRYFFATPAKLEGLDFLCLTLASRDSDFPMPRMPSPSIFVLLGPALAILISLSAWPADMELSARLMFGVTIWMAVWWVSDAVPMAVTALLPTLLFPLLGILNANDTARAYAHPMLFLFLGGFLLAKAMEVVNLHKRLALSIVLSLGGSPTRVLLGFIIATASLSAWISNTATAVMMVPLAIATAAYLGIDDQGRRASVPLLLGVAYAASIGGLATLIGTPTNGIFAAQISERYQLSYSFAEWLGIGLPVTLLLLAALYFYLSRSTGLHLRAAGDGLSQVRFAHTQLGPIRPEERRVAVVFMGMALAWSLSPLYADYVPLSDAGIAVLGSIVLFILPGQGVAGRLLDWPTASTVPWGVLLLFAGGLALAAGFGESGLASYLGMKLSAVAVLPPILVLLIIVTFVNFLTEVTSNVATASVLLPIIAEMAENSGQDPMPLLAGATLAASCAFMLPVATAPNAVVFGSNELSVLEMAKKGFAMNLISIVIITLWLWYIY